MLESKKQHSAKAKIKARTEWIKNKQNQRFGPSKKGSKPMIKRYPKGTKMEQLTGKRPSSGKLKRPKYGPGKVTPRGR